MVSNVGTCSFSRVALGWRNRFCAERLRWPIDRAGRDALQDRQRPVFPEGDKLPRRHARVGILSLPSRHFFLFNRSFALLFYPLAAVAFLADDAPPSYDTTAVWAECADEPGQLLAQERSRRRRPNFLRRRRRADGLTHFLSFCLLFVRFFGNPFRHVKVKKKKNISSNK